MPDSEQDERTYIENSNVTDWIQIGGFLIAAQLTIIALIWQGIYTVMLLLMLSFAFLVNLVFSNSKANFLVKLIKCEEKDEENKETYTTKVIYHSSNVNTTFELLY